MPAGYLAQVTLPSSTNLPADDVVNTFAFAFPLGLPTDPLTLGEMLEAFYCSSVDTTASISESMSGALSRSRPAMVKVYNLADPEPRIPFYTYEFTLDPPATNDPLPNEVALCLSYFALPESGEPLARRRGRIYLGPLNSAALDLDTVDQPVPDPAFVQNVQVAAQRLYSHSVGGWSVWSRADNILYPLIGSAVDNEFDTQRRRGRRATSRDVQIFEL